MHCEVCSPLDSARTKPVRTADETLLLERKSQRAQFVVIFLWVYICKDQSVLGWYGSNLV